MAQVFHRKQEITTTVILLQNKKRWQRLGIGFLSTMKRQQPLWHDHLTWNNDHCQRKYCSMWMWLLMHEQTKDKHSSQSVSIIAWWCLANFYQWLWIKAISVLKRIWSTGWISQMESDTLKGTKPHLKNEKLTMVKLLSFRVTPEHFILLVLKFIKYFFLLNLQ